MPKAALQKKELQNRASAGERVSKAAGRQNLHKRGFRNKSFKRGLQRVKESKRLRANEMCRNRALGSRAKESSRGKKSVGDCPKT